MYLVHIMDQIHPLVNEPEKRNFAYIYEAGGGI
jgi:hypothetical protein